MENITFEKIQEANKMIRSITIHGKEYATVEQRFKRSGLFILPGL